MNMKASLPLGLSELLALGSQMPLSPKCDMFYFLRHGQTACNARRVFQSPQEPLDETGRAQARQAAQCLARQPKPIRSIVSSDASRAWETAHTVAAACHVEPVVANPGLRERNFGALIGTSSLNLDWACKPEGGEDLPQFMRRVHTALNDALAYPAPVLVVAHGGTLYALATMLGIEVESPRQLLGNALPLCFQRSGSIWLPHQLLQYEADANQGAAIA